MGLDYQAYSTPSKGHGATEAGMGTRQFCRGRGRSRAREAEARQSEIDVISCTMHM